MLRILLIFLMTGTFFVSPLMASEPITPLPKLPEYDIQLASLGKKLFFDPLLSKTKTHSCATCHRMEQGGAENQDVSIGINGQLGGINAPSVFNSRYNFVQFWNGRAKSLEEQALMPIQNPVEMGLELSELIGRLQGHEEYPSLFKQTFGQEGITAERIAKALAEFERALVTPNSRFDRFLRHEIALTHEERLGYQLFKDLGCISCHNGINVGSNSFQTIGIANYYPWHDSQGDRYQITGREEDKNRFKVPTLRNVALTAPYFHNAEAKDLKAAVLVMAYYNLGAALDEDEVDLIVAFLNSLTGERPAILEAP